jgi:hypothetical protein
MIANFFRKPLQGALFVNFRDIIMGTTHFSTLTAPDLTKPRSVLKRTISKENTLPSTDTIQGDARTTHGIPTKNVKFQSSVDSKDSSHFTRNSR